jgi:hypothetical protein
VVVPGIDRTSGTWKDANVAWFTEPSRWSVPLAASGPADWPRGTDTASTSPSIAPTSVSHVKVGVANISFDVGSLGKPVLIRESYYPRWHVAGAEGPYRVSPNFMVVIPTAHHVSLTYGADAAVNVGMVVTVLSIAGIVVTGVMARPRRWRRRPDRSLASE